MGNSVEALFDRTCEDFIRTHEGPFWEVSMYQEAVGTWFHGRVRAWGGVVRSWEDGTQQSLSNRILPRTPLHEVKVDLASSHQTLVP